MAISFGATLLVFVFIASVALGVATAWSLFAYTRKRWVWLLTPLLVFLWLLVGTVPIIVLAWDTSATRTVPITPPAPPVVVPPPGDIQAESQPAEPADPTTAPAESR